VQWFRKVRQPSSGIAVSPFQLQLQSSMHSASCNGKDFSVAQPASENHAISTLAYRSGVAVSWTLGSFVRGKRSVASFTRETVVRLSRASLRHGLHSNKALHSDAPSLRSGCPRSLRSLGAGERRRWASNYVLTGGIKC
jgi:hypothetical protein